MTSWDPGTGHLLRPRLIAPLRRAALIALEAPSGYGKTALIAELVRVVGLEERWIRVESECPSASPLGLLNRAVEKAAELGMVMAEPVDGRTADDCIDVLAGIEGPAMLSFDGVIEDSSLDQYILGSLGRNPLLRVVVSSRTTGRFTSMLVRWHGSSALLTAKELALTTTEAQAVIEGYTGAPLSAPMLAESYSPLAVKIAAVRIRSGMSGAIDDPPSLSALLEHLLVSLEPEVRADVIRLAPITRAPGEWLPSLLGLTHPDSAVLAARELGIVERVDTDSGADVVVLPSFREPLLAIFNREHPGEIEGIWRSVAMAALEKGDPLEALAKSVAARDYYLASRVLYTSWNLLLWYNANETSSIIDSIESRIRNRFPVLTFVQALIANSRGQRARASALFLSASRAIRAPGPDHDPVERCLILSMRSAAFRLTGQYKRAVRDAKDAHDAAADLFSRRPETATVGVLSAIIHAGITFIHVGDFDRANDVFDLVRANALPDIMICWYHAVCLQAGIAAHIGDIPAAKSLLKRIDDANLPARWRWTYHGYFAVLARAQIALEAGEFSEARTHLVSVEHHFSTIEHWPFALSVAAAVDLADGSITEGLVEIKASLHDRTLPVTSPYTRAIILRRKALLLLAEGSKPAANAVLRALPSSVETTVVRTLRDFLAGNTERALVTLASCRGSEPTQRRPRADATMLALLAVVARRLQRDEMAQSYAAEAVAIMVKYELRTPLIALPAEDARWLAELTGIDLAPNADLFRMLPHFEELSRREQDVLFAMTVYPTREEVAASLHVSPNTIKTQISSIYRKLGVSTREAALMRGAQLGIIIANYDDQQSP